MKAENFSTKCLLEEGKKRLLENKKEKEINLDGFPVVFVVDQKKINNNFKKSKINKSFVYCYSSMTEAKKELKRLGRYYSNLVIYACVLDHSHVFNLPSRRPQEMGDAVDNLISSYGRDTLDIESLIAASEVYPKKVLSQISRIGVKGLDLGTASEPRYYIFDQDSLTVISQYEPLVSEGETFSFHLKDQNGRIVDLENYITSDEMEEKLNNEYAKIYNSLKDNFSDCCNVDPDYNIYDGIKLNSFNAKSLVRKVNLGGVIDPSLLEGIVEIIDSEEITSLKGILKRENEY